MENQNENPKFIKEELVHIAPAPSKHKEKYELVNSWEERVRSLEGIMVVMILYGFLMLFAGFMLGVFFIGAGG